MATTSGIAGRIARTFINSKLTPLLMAAFLGIGLYSAWVTPKEEDPQIEVPMMDIAVQYPGATPQEVKSRVAEPIERLASNIDGVEYVYSTAMPGRAMVSVRYYVGEDPSTSTVKLYEELLKNMDEMPPGASRPLIKSRAVDDVPILTLTLHSETTGDYELRRIGEEMAADLKTTDGVAEVSVHGGRPRQVRVALQPNQLAAHELDPPSVAEQLRAANQETDAGAFQRMDESYLVETGGFLTSVDDVKTLVVGMHQGSPVYLKQVAEVTDGPAEPKNYVSFSYGAGTPRPDSLAQGGARSAVTVAVAKRNGRDAMTIAEHSLDKLETLEQTLVPEDVTVSTTRNYGETASEKTNELMLHLLAAILAVTFVVSLAMGWRGGLVVFLSVPISFALTLFVYYFFGYTLNRITLFALIFVTGIVVDDSIIVAENIERHFKMGRLPKLQSALAAVDEVGNPTILATLTVIAAVLPMAFVSGLMGPYMSPMPIGASVAMTFSLVVALVIAPYLAFRLIPSHEALTGEEGGGDDDNDENDSEYELEETAVYRAYAATIEPLLDSAWKRWAFLGGTTLLLLGSVSLFYFRAVTVKMLPFDDKNEFQVVVDMPEGTPLERTNAVLREMAADLTDRPVVTDVQTYAGDAAPVNLNGLVRHYDLRSAPHQGDLQVNLRAAHHRTRQSHAIAKDLRGPLQKIGENYDAAVKVAEVPPVQRHLHGLSDAGGGRATSPRGGAPGEPRGPAERTGPVAGRPDRADGRPRRGGGNHARQAHQPQKPAARHLRDGQRGRGHREPGLRHARHAGAPGRHRGAAGLLLRPAVHRPPRGPQQLRAEVGRGVARHLQGVPRPGHRLRHRAAADLHPDRGVVSGPHRAPGDDDRHSTVAHRHRAGALAPGRVLYRHLHDRLHRPRGHHGAQRGLADRLRKHQPRSGRLAASGRHRGRGRADAPHFADGRHGGHRGDGHPVRPHLSGPGHLADRGRDRLHGAHAPDRAARLLHD